MSSLGEPQTNKERGPVEFTRRYFLGRKLVQGFSVNADVTPSRFVEQAYFTLYLARDNQSSSAPIFSGIFSAGRQSQSIAGWVDGDYFESTDFPDASRVELSEGDLDVELFKLLGGLVPSGGSLMVSYVLFSKESRVHKETKLGLDRGYPPVVTPLGFLLFAAGCGMGFKDWYFAEGGREGPEKLQGFKPLNRQSATEKGKEILREVKHFLSRMRVDDELALGCRARAEYVARELENIQ